MKSLRVGLLGSGEVVKAIHGPGYRDCSQAQLTAIASRNPANAARLAGEYGIPEVYTSYEALLANPDLDAVSICTPPATHLYLTELAIANGKHVLVEKPIEISLAGVNRMTRLAEQSNVIVQVVRNERFMQLNQRSKEILQSGELGRALIVLQSVATTGPESWAPAADWFRDPTISGGGAFMDLGVHKVDLAVWLLEKDVDEIRPPCVDRWPVENLGAINLKLGQQLATVAVSWYGPKDESTLQILGSEGMLMATGSTGEILISRGGEVRREKVEAPWSADDRSPQAMVAEFVQRCLNQQKPGGFERETWNSGTRWVLEAYAALGHG